MCGIIGAVSQRDISKILVEGLRRLEYRGYDSAGVALIDTKGHFSHLRMKGKVQALADAMAETALSGHTGIAHTRWATHGKPSEKNAHPQLSNNELAIVHNGIIENHESLKQMLKAKGYEFLSETDTEIAAHLIHYHFKRQGNLLEAVQAASEEMHGAFALGVIHKASPDQLVALRKGSPLVVGMGIGENLIASDAMALRSFADKVIYLEEGDSAIIGSENVVIYDKERHKRQRKTHPLNLDNSAVSKGPYRHFMLKEIYEQTEVIAETLQGRISSPEILRASFGEKASSIFPEVKHIQIIACGTSYHAGLVAKYWLEALAGIPTQVEIASEYRYREVIVDENTLFITVSQSGETADTLAALEKAKKMNYLASLAICNVASSSLVREADIAFLTRAGIEIGVASTKAFTTQLASFLMLAAALSSDKKANEVIKQLEELPAICEKVLKMDKQIETLSYLFVNKAHSLFLGRGVQYPVAMEGALKLKEISYIHAEAYPAGELKHGPLALVDEEMPVIAIAPNDELFDKLKSNLHEVSARGGQLFVFADKNREWRPNGVQIIHIPHCGSWVSPIVYTIPLQLLAYHVAVVKGTDVDQPRNLAKSVTVE
jgi:glucosamine--fructose-6-phosphate aminotransferase (isomerizing)